MSRSDAPPPRSPSGGRLLAHLGARSGTILGRYELVRRIGRGGMAEVYEAVHRGLKKSVAIKVLLPEIAENEDLRARFLREGEAAAHIRHPHVVDVTDVGEEGGVPYLVMELLEGQPLSELVAMGHLSIVRALDILLPIGAALSEAHRRGVIHRDLKPENVFIARTSGGKAVPKLLDFGVSKLARGDRAHTAMAAVLGTPDYMAPEQALGETEVDDRADQYSFALMVYECIAGRLPFESQNVVALLHEVARGVTVAPSRFVPEIAPEIDAILLRALSADPAARYPSVSDLLAALLPFASARASLAYRTLLGERSDFASSRSGSTSRSEITAQFVQARAAAPTQDVTPAVRATPADRGAAEARNTPVRATPTPTPTPTPVAIDAELAPSGATAEAPSQRTSVPAPESERATRSRAQIGVLVALVGLLALGLAAWTVLVPSDPEHLPEVTTPAHPIEPPASAEHAPPVTHEPPPTTAEPAPAPTPVMMRIVLVVTPGSASIVLDEGEPVTSPLDLELPADGRTHTLTASAPGYRSETLTFVDRPPAPRLALVRLGGGVHPPGGGAATTTSQDDDIRTQR